MQGLIRMRVGVSKRARARILPMVAGVVSGIRVRVPSARAD